MKIAFVIARYSEGISGGAERHTSSLAHALVKRGHDVSVYTSRAVDYHTWENVLPEGEQDERGVRIYRFSQQYSRNQKRFAKLTNAIFSKNCSIGVQKDWLKEQGPYVPSLSTALADEVEPYDVIICVGYLYQPVHDVVLTNPGKVVLIPLLHEEPAVHLGIMKGLFSNAGMLIFNSQSEMVLAETLFHIKNKPRCVLGVWPEIPDSVHSMTPTAKKMPDSPYVLYVGRVAKSKGCDELVRYFRGFKSMYKSDLKLLLMGTSEMTISHSDDIVVWGYASEEEKWYALKNAICCVIPSQYESLSLLLLESFGVSCPVIVNGGCAVTVEHCRRSNGGLWYNNGAEFAEALRYINEHTQESEALGRNGNQYVGRYYTEQMIMDGFESFLQKYNEPS